MKYIDPIALRRSLELQDLHEENALYRETIATLEARVRYLESVFGLAPGERVHALRKPVLIHKGQFFLRVFVAWLRKRRA